jgi:hypothetical protein
MVPTSYVLADSVCGSQEGNPGIREERIAPMCPHETKYFSHRAPPAVVESYYAANAKHLINVEEID